MTSRAIYPLGKFCDVLKLRHLVAELKFERK